MKSRQIYRLRPFFLVLLTAGILAAFSLFNNVFVLNGFSFRQLDVFSDIRVDTTSQLEIGNKDLTIDSLDIDKNLADSLHINLDSLLEAEKADLRITDYRADSLPMLSHFFESLTQAYLKKGKARIAYFGDSMIEGDLITQTLRELLQAYFGGRGVGFVPVYSITSGFRTTITTRHNQSWRMYNFLNHYGKKKNFGLSGFVFNPIINRYLSDTGKFSVPSWVEYFAPKTKSSSLNEFEIVDFFYGKGSPKNRMFVKTDTSRKNYVLDGNRAVNKLNIHNGRAIKRIRAQFNSDTLIDAYGFSFESEHGVFVDNYSVRSNSGMPLAGISSSILSDFNAYLDYDLIILQYGLNVSSPSMRNYDWYEKAMIKVINHLKASFPNADILIISVGDRGSKRGLKMETMPCIPYLVESQRKIAKETKTAFWDLYQSMGGRNSMVQWVDSIQPLANKDYTHVNHLGAQKIGNMLYNNIINEYRIYKSKH